MSKENVKEEVKGITVGECYGLNRAIFELSGSTPSMKGNIVYALRKNEAKLASILKSTDKKQEKILKKYVTLNKDGSYKLTEPTEEEIAVGKQPEYIYEVEANKEKASKEVTDIVNSEANIELHKIRKSDFDNLDISPARNQNIGLIIDFLIVETDNLQLV